MSQLDLQMVREDWAGHMAAMPEPFVLVGYESPYVLARDGRPPLIIDAEGIILASGAVYTWCRAGCCAPEPRKWPRIEAAAEFHGSYIVVRREVAHCERAHEWEVRLPDMSPG